MVYLEQNREVKLHTSYLKICACGIDHFGVKSSSSSFSFVDSFVDSTDMLNFLFFLLFCRSIHAHNVTVHTCSMID